MPPKLQAVYDALAPSARGPFIKHVQGGTSAEWLARTLTAHGFPVGATTIKTYRRSLKGGVQSGQSH